MPDEPARSISPSSTRTRPDTRRTGARLGATRCARAASSPSTTSCASGRVLTAGRPRCGRDRAFNDMVLADERVDSVLMPIADGITLDPPPVALCMPAADPAAVIAAVLTNEALQRTLRQRGRPRTVQHRQNPMSSACQTLVVSPGHRRRGPGWRRPPRRTGSSPATRLQPQRGERERQQDAGEGAAVAGQRPVHRGGRARLRCAA